ncbi:MAG TPA: hypothetical protein VMU82_05060, partial [Acetobacteraceae bacterium]|nr:hypothetical protein [Acetobacteraceae bacterium]
GLTSGAIAIPGALSAPVLALDATAGGIGGAGRLAGLGGTAAATLGAAASNGISLTNAANAIGTLTALTGGSGDVVLANGTALSVNGTVSGSNVTLDNAGAITLASGSVVTAGVLGLTALAGNISEGAGFTIRTGMLNGSAQTGISLTSASNAINALGNLSGGSGDVALANGTALSVDGSVSGSNITLANAGAITLAGGGALLTGGAGTLALATSNGGIAEQTGFTINAGTLTSDGTTTQGAFALGQGSNTITSLGAIASTGGFSLTDQRSLTVAGTVTDNTGITIALTNGDLTIGDAAQSLGGRLASSQTVALTLPGALTEATGLGSLQAGVLIGQANSAQLTQTNTVATLGSFSAPNGFSLNDTGPLAVAGAVDGGTGLSLTTTGDLTFGADATGSTMVLNAGGNLAQTGGTITAALLLGHAQSVTLPQQNRIATLGGFTAANNFTLTDANTLTLAGPLSAGGPAVLAAPALILSGAVNAPSIDLLAADITEPGGLLTTALLTGQGQTVNLTDQNQIATLGSFTATSGFALTDGRTLTVTGPLASPQIALNVTGDLLLPGALPQGGAVALNATGTITDTGELQASTLSGSAAAASFTGPGGVGTLDAFTTTGDFTLDNLADLAGPLSAANATVDSLGNLAITGDVNVPGTLILDAAGTIIRSGGAFNVGELTGQANAVANFGSAVQLAELGSFIMTGSTFTLSDARALTILGPIVAGEIAISATGTLTLSGNLFTTGLPPGQQEGAQPSPPGTFFTVLPGADGKGSFIQTGTVYINPSFNTAVAEFGGPAAGYAGTPATVRIDLPSAGGAIQFNNLVAPTTTLIINPGAGQATGTINVANLIALALPGSTGGSTLTGMVGGFAGVAAAGISTITPLPLNQFRINSCPIMSVNCVVLPLEAVPSSNPIDNLDFGTTRRRRRDRYLQLPNVSAQDY